jgi:hypothetical protein
MKGRIHLEVPGFSFPPFFSAFCSLFLLFFLFYFYVNIFFCFLLFILFYFFINILNKCICFGSILLPPAQRRFYTWRWHPLTHYQNYSYRWSAGCLAISPRCIGEITIHTIWLMEDALRSICAWILIYSLSSSCSCFWLTFISVGFYI